MSVETVDPTSVPVLTMSNEAAEKVREFIAEEGPEVQYLRVFIQGGGCSGLQYNFTFESEAQEDDTVCEINELKILIDPLSYPYLAGATITFQESLHGSRFSIDNPNATSTCGCGSSFSA